MPPFSLISFNTFSDLNGGTSDFAGILRHSKAIVKSNENSQDDRERTYSSLYVASFIFLTYFTSFFTQYYLSYKASFLVAGVAFYTREIAFSTSYLSSCNNSLYIFLKK